MDRPEIFRALAIVVLIAVFIVALAAINHPSDTSKSTDSPSVSTLDDLSDELRRCSTLGPQDTEDARCQAVWEKNRRRFFGRPDRPLPPEIESKKPTPTNNATPNPATAGDAP